ncbi:MAG: Rdx family protein [Proteobacteria bacterium]|nr:Rdx family protein [Pseudomonadota bacterium]
MSAEIKQYIGIDAVLIAGSGGIFDVRRDGQLVFSKHQLARFPEVGETSRLLSQT